jgi:branched-subunit amino acid aminotransferase/4-amino-4-deoxychorismate lyase
VLDGTLVTHPTGPHILGGITRDVVLRLGADLELQVRESPFSQANIYGAQEVFLTSTTAEVLPITQIDGRSVAQGEPGPVTLRLHEEFGQAVRKE